jgi:hypothetical protein
MRGMDGSVSIADAVIWQSAMLMIVIGRMDNRWTLWKAAPYKA